MNTPKSLAVAAFFAAVVLPQTVLARGQSAFLGVPASADAAQCWSHSNGTVTNKCVETKGWCMPATVERTGAFSNRVYVKMDSFTTSTEAIACQATVVNTEGVVVSQTQLVSITKDAVSKYIDMGNVSVPSQGTLYACCNVSSKGTLVSYIYN